jgi:polyisoprenoid-binding protein YceI
MRFDPFTAHRRSPVLFNREKGELSMRLRNIGLLIAVFSLLILAAACNGAAPAAPAPAAPAPAEPAAPAAPVEAPEAAATPAGEEEADDTAVSEPAEVESAEASAPGGVMAFSIVPEESTAAYIVREEFFADALSKYGIGPGPNVVRGTTQAIEGQLTLDFDNLSSALGENRFTVDMTTLTTDQNLRDQWIRTDGPRFNQYPVAEFVATDIQGAPAAYNAGDEVNFQLIGDLTIREITQRVTFDVTARLDNNTLTGVAVTNGELTDFGIDPPDFFNTLTVANALEIEISFVARAN